MRSALVILGLAAAGAAGAAPQAPRTINVPTPLPQFQLPLACEPGRTCWVQSYVDRDPGPAHTDYRCGSMTYDRHTGTDIRLASLNEMRRGVRVLAAAPGRVRAVRDGMIDLSIKDPSNPRIEGQDCGNTAIVDHEWGWSSIYCHMKRGSLRVKAGDQVKVGQVLGEVGLSGDTEFPHLHFEVRREKAIADPFAVGPAACNSGGVSLWAPPVRAQLAYRSPSLLVAGFAAGPVEGAAIDSGAIAAPTRASALVAYARVIGLEAGDVQQFAILGPDGKAVVTHADPPLERPKAQVNAYIGERRPPPGGWKAGTYRAGYAVRRGGKLVLQHGWSITLALP